MDLTVFVKTLTLTPLTFKKTKQNIDTIFLCPIEEKKSTFLGEMLNCFKYKNAFTHFYL